MQVAGDSVKFQIDCLTQQNILLAIYVDDILVMGPQIKCDEFAIQLGRRFNIVNNGLVSSFLAINIERTNGIIGLTCLPFALHAQVGINVNSSCNSWPSSSSY